MTRGGAAVDDLALVEASGAQVALTPGRAQLMKVTLPEDMAIVEKLISAPALRVGTGFDVHGFEGGDRVVLCGVTIPHSKKLQGHSDADVGWHALTDAILGAAALGDIGDHFPPSDSQWQGADSRVFLRHAVELAAGLGLRVVNADITLLCEQPKIGPHREAMRAATAEVHAGRHRLYQRESYNDGKARVCGARRRYCRPGCGLALPIRIGPARRRRSGQGWHRSPQGDKHV